MEKVTVVITIKNEEKTLSSLLLALEQQTRLPDEVVIVDANSSDGSQKILSQWKPSFSVKIIVQESHRSEGRNIGIRHAKHDVIAITDAGCIPDKKWLEELLIPLLENRDVVSAGGYYPYYETSFQFACSYFFLVPPKYITEGFLPATRSMAFSKKTWEKVGGFQEDLASSEDYVFAKKIQKLQIPIAVQDKATVAWSPPKTIYQFAFTIFSFARWDVLGNVFRKKVLTMYARYAVFLLVIIISKPIGFLLFFTYLLWATFKHAQWISGKALLYIPALQIISDHAVMIGTLYGVLEKYKFL